MGAKIGVAVLGATGVVGQRLVAALKDHPWFELSAVTGSERSAGLPYGRAVNWRLGGEAPRCAAEMIVKETSPDGIEASVVLSALDSSVAADAERRFRAAGFTVVSNASACRLDPEVPLIIPEINPSHLALAPIQRARHKGAIVTNPNCSTIGLCLALAPLMPLGPRAVRVTTLQALSGAGYPGVASLDAIDNVLPFIAGEEEKLEREPLKIFGDIKSSGVVNARLAVSAQCNRVAVTEGHLLSVSVETAQRLDEAEASALLNSYPSKIAAFGLPSAVDKPVVVMEDQSRPQPRLDRDSGGGMTVTVGRVRKTAAGDLRLVALVHNTIRGAAGGTLLIAEMMKAQDLL